jgi:hypothetical protein
VDDGFPGAREFENNYKPLPRSALQPMPTQPDFWQRVTEACRRLPALRPGVPRMGGFAVLSLKKQ